MCTHLRSTPTRAESTLSSNPHPYREALIPNPYKEKIRAEGCIGNAQIVGGVGTMCEQRVFGRMSVFSTKVDKDYMLRDYAVHM